MLLHLTRCSELPIHEQVTRELAGSYLRGHVAAGAAVAPALALARSNRIRPSAVERAYARLREEGLIERVGDAWVFASLPPPRRAAAARRLGLAGGRQEDPALHEARRIQARLLPADLPRDADAWVAVGSASPQALTGDFHDCVAVGGDRLGLVVGDACGQGLPAAMLASQVQSWLKCELARGEDLAVVLSRLNTILARHTPSNRYVTLSCCVLRRSTGELVHASAGQAGPLHVDRCGAIERLRTSGPPLGAWEDAGYVTGRARLHDGDSLVLYTDGVTETRGRGGEEYGDERLARFLSSHRGCTPAGLVAGVFADLDRVGAGRPPHDDRTLMVLGRGHGREVRAARARESRPSPTAA